MSIDRALQWTTAGVAALGAIFLSLGHESTWLPILLAIAAGFSVLVTDLIPRLRLNRIVGNLLAVAAVSWSLYGYLGRSMDQQLLSIAQMLVFLQVLLLFQAKTGRAYWQLLVLSLLQAVVAAALTAGPLFGTLLAAYMVLSLMTLVLLCLHRDLGLDRQPAAEKRTRATTPPTAEHLLWRPLLARPSVLPASANRQQDASAVDIWQVSRHVAALALAAFGMALVFFYTTPRLSDAYWQYSRRGERPTTGFTPEVQLEESGRILPNAQVVMRVHLSDAVDQRHTTLVGDPYFHGTVLTHYMRDKSGGRWFAASPVSSSSPSRLDESQYSILNLTRQEYVLEQVNSPYVFAILPVQRVKGTPEGLNYRRLFNDIRRSDSDRPSFGGEFRYVWITPAIVNGRQLHAIPHSNPNKEWRDTALLDVELRGLRAFDSRRFGRLKAIAEQCLRQENVADGSDLDRAQALERHFLARGLYRYSTDFNFQREAQLDPIEDFVVNHRQGHCEYFASALVMMLRSQGIPARMVVGYKGGEFNAVGQYYVVRQNNAHAWVEAWIPSGLVPDAEIAGIPHAGGCWYRLDPTPASPSASANSESETLATRLMDAFDYAELMWRDYVVNLNALRQQNAVIDPIAVRTISAATHWAEPRQVQRWLNQWSRRLRPQGESPEQTAIRRAFDWRLAILLSGFMAAVVLIAYLGWAILKRLGWFGRRTATAGTVAHRPPAFYRRFEALVAGLPLSRRAGQTPQELAAVVQKRLARSASAAEVAEMPARIVQAYYKVRFGSATLDNQETSAIEQALEALTPAVGQAQSR